MARWPGGQVTRWPGSAVIAKLWNVRIDLKRPQKGNFESFLVECVWNVRSKIAKCELLAIFNENKISKFFCVWFVDFFHPITGEPLTKRRCLHQISHCAACGITVKRSDLPGDYLKTNQNGLLPGRKWNVRFLLQSVWNANRFDRKHSHARESSQCE
mgnify:CR=1 FL=1